MTSPGAFLFTKMCYILSDIYVSATNRFNSTQAAGERFTGDVSLEKFLTKKLMDARKTRDTFRTNVLRVSTLLLYMIPVAENL
jgi:hypothetical protein